jgi:hypothetical protein
MGGGRHDSTVGGQRPAVIEGTDSRYESATSPPAGATLVAQRHDVGRFRRTGPGARIDPRPVLTGTDRQPDHDHRSGLGRGRLRRARAWVAVIALLAFVVIHRRDA